ncbi:cupin domain-containing protein [Halpernia sp.]|uniref:cupin domain-containing protein n=1 Tax=Halpernia sp. TaxID=2782209 RepID=UPI003A91EEE9
MNIIENKNWTNKPEVTIIKKTEKVKQFAVALGKNGILSKHKAAFPTMLIVLKGEINFNIENQNHHFKTFDTYEIPVNVEHEVTGLMDENLFLLTQEL